MLCIIGPIMSDCQSESSLPQTLPPESTVEAQSSTTSGSTDFAARDAPVDLDEALGMLHEATYAASARVFRAGRPDGQALAFAWVLAQPDATRHFAGLLEAKTRAAQLYGLCGLYLTDRALFEKVVDRFRSLDETVPFIQGCLVGDRPVSEIVSSPNQTRKDIESGSWPRDLERLALEHGYLPRR